MIERDNLPSPRPPPIELTRSGKTLPPPIRAEFRRDPVAPRWRSTGFEFRQSARDGPANGGGGEEGEGDRHALSCGEQEAARAARKHPSSIIVLVPILAVAALPPPSLPLQLLSPSGARGMTLAVDVIRPGSGVTTGAVKWPCRRAV